MADAERRELTREVGSLGRRLCREALAHPPASGVDAQLPSCLGVDEPEIADVGKLLLAAVSDLDRENVVATGELEEGAAPVARPSEVRDDDEERGLARDTGGAGQRSAERRRSDGLRCRFAPEREQDAEEAAPALARR